jgi:hypothetical protein
MAGSKLRIVHAVAAVLVFIHALVTDLVTAGKAVGGTKSSIGQSEQLRQKCQVSVPIFLLYSEAIKPTL